MYIRRCVYRCMGGSGMRGVSENLSGVVVFMSASIYIYIYIYTCYHIIYIYIHKHIIHILYIHIYIYIYSSKTLRKCKKPSHGTKQQEIDSPKISGEGLHLSRMVC